MKKFSAIILDPEMETRMRLKQVCQSVKEFGAVQPVNSMKEALVRLDGDDLLDVVFASGRFKDEEIKQFIKSAKTTKQGQDSTYVIVMKSQQQQGSSSLATVMMLGGDGVLCEPYSVDDLVEITSLSEQIRRERGAEREKMALGMITKDMVHQLDLVAYVKACGCEPGMSIRALKDLGKKVVELEGETLAIYFEAMIDAFENAPLPQRSFRPKVYAGASARVKQQMEKKIMQELSAESPKTE